MKKIDKMLKEFKEKLDTEYIDVDVVKSKIKKLENERFKLMQKTLDTLYEDYSNKVYKKIINIQLDVLYEILGGR